MTFFLTNVIGNKMAKFCNSADFMTSKQILAAQDSKNRFIYIITALNFAIINVHLQIQPSNNSLQFTVHDSTIASLLFMKRYKAIYL